MANNTSSNTLEAFNNNAQLYQTFKQQEQDMLSKSGVLLARVFYLLDHKAIAYKLECEPEYLMTFINKKDKTTKSETMHLLSRLCSNQEVQNLFLKEQNFQVVLGLSHQSKVEEVRSSCFKIFSILAKNPSKQMVKQLYFKTDLLSVTMKQLKGEESEDVLCSILSFLINLTSDDDFTELITQDLQIVQEILQLMNYRKNQQIKTLAYALTLNFLCDAELRKALMKQSQVDITAKLIGILQSNSQGKLVNSKQEIITALQALCNATLENLLLLSFLQQKGHIALNQVFEIEDLQVKEVCLALYVRLAQDKENNIIIVLESDLIYDILNLNVKDPRNMGVIRNMLILILVMLVTGNEKAIEQMKKFDLLTMLLSIMTECQTLGYLALSCIGLLASKAHFREQIQTKNEDASVMDMIINCLRNYDVVPVSYKFFLRSIQVYLLGFDEIEGNLIEVDQAITMVSVLNDVYDSIGESTSQYYLILVLKRLSEMRNRQITEIIDSLERFAQQMLDAPSISKDQQIGFVNDLLEKDLQKHTVFYQTDCINREEGLIVFFSDTHQQQAVQSNNSKQEAELAQLKFKQQNMVAYINEIESEKTRLEQEIRALVGVSTSNKFNQGCQTDTTESQQIIEQVQDPKLVIKKLKEDLEYNKRTSREQQKSIGYLQDRMVELEQDLQIRDKAISKLTHGSQIVEVVGAVKQKIHEDLDHKFQSFKSHIQDLESVIDRNTKLINDLTESIQERNIENQSLFNEDKVRLGKIEQFSKKIATLEQQVQSHQSKETQFRMILESIKEKGIDIPQMPDLQLSSEQLQIAELQEQLTVIRVENLRLEEANTSFENYTKRQEVIETNLIGEIEKLKSKQGILDSQLVLKQIQANPKSLDETVQKINVALDYIDKHTTRTNFKDQLLVYFEDKLRQQSEKYEQLLFSHLMQQTRHTLAQTQLHQVQLSSPQPSDLLQQQWQQSYNAIDKVQQFSTEQFQENKRLRIQLQEIEEQLVKYKKYVILDQHQYDRLINLKDESPLSSLEQGIVSLFLQQNQQSEVQRISKILDIIIKNNLDLEYRLLKDNSEKLRNEYHLIIEQREIELRQRMVLKAEEVNVRKLEYLVMQMESELEIVSDNSKEGNSSQRSLQQAFLMVTQIQELVAKTKQEGQVPDYQSNQQPYSVITSAQPVQKQSAEPNAEQQNQQLQQPQKKKAQGTNLVSTDPSKKPRLQNDYNKKVKTTNAPPGDISSFLQKIEHYSFECHKQLQAIREVLTAEQNLKVVIAGDSIQEVKVLKGALNHRQQEQSELITDVKRILLQKNELTNILMVKDFQLSPGSSNQKHYQQEVAPINSCSNEQLQRIEGLVKVNNFLRKKELEAQEKYELHKHKSINLDKERLSLSLENRKLTDQVRYLQTLLIQQREQFVGGVVGKSSSKDNQEEETDQQEPHEDKMVKLLEKIDELQQRSSELEYLLESALKSNIQKDKLMRGTEDLVEAINCKIEFIGATINSNMGLQAKLLEFPEFMGADSIYQRLQVLQQYIQNWAVYVTNQHSEIVRQNEATEQLKPSNQMLTQPEQQQKLEKYLSIYSCRIQTLSSIIGSYQRHFKALEEQVRQLQGLPNPAAEFHPTQKHIETVKIEALKRMISLKDILIKHQQQEIELIKKTVINDKNNQHIEFVTKPEKESLALMRQFDTQIKVIQDFERGTLLIKEDTTKRGEEHVYLKEINAKLQSELTTVSQIYNTASVVKPIGNSKDNKLNKEKTTSQKGSQEDYYLRMVEIEQNKKDFLQRWLNIVQDMIQSQFQEDKCKFFLEQLNQEIPILLSIQLAQQHQPSQSTQKLPENLEKSQLKQKIEELQQQIQDQQSDIIEHKERSNFLRQLNQKLQEQNILLKRFMHSKKAMADDFKRFYKASLLRENQHLKTLVLHLTPYNEKLAVEVSVLRIQVNDLHLKISRQDERIMNEQQLFQNLEQTLLDTQKKLFDKDNEAIRVIKQQKDELLKGTQDQFFNTLLATADTLSTECTKLREQNWQLTQNLTQKRQQLEQKTQEIKQSKSLLESFEGELKDLRIENEKLKVVKAHPEGSDSNVISILLEEKAIVNKDKLIYELGKEGANTALRFLDEISYLRKQLNSAVCEVADFKVKNSGLRLLVENKSLKLKSSLQGLQMKQNQLEQKEVYIDKIEYLNQKLNDDYISSQQALDVYAVLAANVVSQNQKQVFAKAIDNAKTLAILLSDVQRQRDSYHGLYTQHEKTTLLQKDKLKLKNNELDQLRSELHLKNQLLHHSQCSLKALQGMLTRYDQELKIVGMIEDTAKQGIQSTKIGITEKSLTQSKTPHLSVIDSPQLLSRKLEPQKKQQQVQQEYSSKRTDQSENSSIHLILTFQLELNSLKSQLVVLDQTNTTLKKSVSREKLLQSVYQQENTQLTQSELKLQRDCSQLQTQLNVLKLQNVYLARLSLYSYRTHKFVAGNDQGKDQAQVQELMSNEIDKLKIENKLLQEYNEKIESRRPCHFEQPAIQEGEKGHQQKLTFNCEKQRADLLENELNESLQWSSKLERELLAKAAQIEALSKIHNDFNQATQQLQSVSQTNSAQASSDVLDEDSKLIIQNLRSEYDKLQTKNQGLYEKIYLLDNKLKQRDTKIDVLGQKIRQLQQAQIGLASDDGPNGNSQPPARSNKHKQSKLPMISCQESAVDQELELDEVWKKFMELNDLKNNIQGWNEGLRTELDSFKTHFSKYDTEDYKKRLSSQDKFNSSLYTELTLLRQERDLLFWHLYKQQSKIQHQSSQVSVLSKAIPSLEKQVSISQDKEQGYLREIGNLKEQLVHASSKDFNQIKVLLELYEGNRLKREKVSLMYENGRIRRENEGLALQITSSSQMMQHVIKREFALKEKIITLKNELVKIKVATDMGQYQTLTTGKSSQSKQTKKPTDQQMEKVKQYVEDLTVMREALLKIEFRNIELEENNTKKDRDLFEAKEHLKELQDQLKRAEQGECVSQDNKHSLLETDKRVIDLQHRLMEEKGNGQQLQHSNDKLVMQVKELSIIQDKFFEEVKDHQQLNAQLAIQKQQIQDLKRPHQQLGLDDMGGNRGDITFYDALKERFLMYLSLYIDQIRVNLKETHEVTEKNRLLQNQLIRMQVEIDCFQPERESYKSLIDKLITQKVKQVEEEFVSTIALEDGLSKTEVHIINQRKQLVLLKGQLETAKTEKIILEYNKKAQAEVVKTLERNQMDLNGELTQSKDELVRLRGEKDRFQGRIQFMWDRLDFQQRLHHKVTTNNATLEQVIEVYKLEIQGLQSFFLLNTPAISLAKPHQVEKDLPKANSNSHTLELEHNLVRLKNKEQRQTEQVWRLASENDQLKLYIQLADMVRRAIGVTQQERETLNAKINQKKFKIKDLKQKSLKGAKTIENLEDQVSRLEQQIMGLKKANSSLPTSVKANIAPEDQDESQVSLEHRRLLSQIKQLERQNLHLKQQIQELNGAIQGLQSSSEQQKSSVSTSQLKKGMHKKAPMRTVTPLRIGELQLKNATQKYSRQQTSVNDFYYGQRTAVDPLQILDQSVQDDESLQDKDKYNTKLPQIAHTNYQKSHFQTVREGPHHVAEKRQMNNATHQGKSPFLSFTEDRYQSQSHKPILDPKLSRISKEQKSLASPRSIGQDLKRKNSINKTVNAPMDVPLKNSSFLNSNRSNVGPALTHQGTFSNNNFMFKHP